VSDSLSKKALAMAKEQQIEEAQEEYVRRSIFSTNSQIKQNHLTSTSRDFSRRQEARASVG
jgi:hypothetical protein